MIVTMSVLLCLVDFEVVQVVVDHELQIRTRLCFGKNPSCFPTFRSEISSSIAKSV